MRTVSILRGMTTTTLKALSSGKRFPSIILPPGYEHLQWLKGDPRSKWRPIELPAVKPQMLYSLTIAEAIGLIMIAVLIGFSIGAFVGHVGAMRSQQVAEARQ